VPDGNSAAEAFGTAATLSLTTPAVKELRLRLGETK